MTRLLLVLLAGLSVCACDSRAPGRSSEADYSAPPPSPEEAARIAQDVAANDDAKPRTFGKRQFTAYTFGKTKAEIRQLLGSPSEVSDTSPTGRVSWFYWNMPIYDEEAGTQAKVARLTFESDRVVEVGF
jgi:hypothetical protein